MWIWIVGGVAVAAFLLSRVAGGAIRSRFVTVTPDGQQHVVAGANKTFASEMAHYHVFGPGVEKIAEGVVLVRGKRDVGALEQGLPRLFALVSRTAGTTSGGLSTLMEITELDALLSGRKPQSLTVYVAPRTIALSKSREGSPLAIID